MTTVEGPVSSGLVARIKGILLSPKAEWAKIDGEPATVQGLFTGYVCLLAAIPAVCTIIGLMAFGGSYGVRIPVVGAVVMGVFVYIAQLVSTFLVAFVADALASNFGGQKNMVQATKAVAYSYTAAWVAGVFYIIPSLGRLLVALGALYGLYLLYLGLSRMMKVSEDKAVAYTIVTIIAAIVVYAVIMVAFGVIAAMSFVTGAVATGAAFSGA